MTKAEFVNEVARTSGLSNRDAEKAVDAFLAAVKETLRDGDVLKLTGVGELRKDQDVPVEFSLVKRHDRLEELGRAAEELRGELVDLQKAHRESVSRIDLSRKTLREIANAS